MAETLSLQVNVSPTGSKLEAFVKYTCEGKGITLFVPVTYAYTEPSTGFDFYVALQDVRFYADPARPSGSACTPPTLRAARCSSLFRVRLI